VRFEISRRARRQIDKIQAWWTDNRPEARSLFLDELSGAERLLRGTPEAGIVYAAHATGDVRRVLLRRADYHLYYRYQASRDELVVLMVWGAAREHGPRL